MLKVSVAHIGRESGEEIPFSFEVPAGEIELSDVPDGEDRGVFEGKLRIEGKVVSTGKGFRAEGTVKCRKRFICDRCLEISHENQEHFFSEEFPGDGWEDFDGETIELSGLVRDTILLGQPMGSLCSPDCKGLCPVCGKNLNLEECECVPAPEDTRFAALKALDFGQ